MDPDHGSGYLLHQEKEMVKGKEKEMVKGKEKETGKGSKGKEKEMVKGKEKETGKGSKGKEKEMVKGKEKETGKGKGEETGKGKGKEEETGNGKEKATPLTSSHTCNLPYLDNSNLFEVTEFRNLITDIRMKLPRSNGVYVLPLEPVTPIFQISITFPKFAIDLQYRNRDLYLVGYRAYAIPTMSDNDTQWFEFPNEDDVHHIQGSKFLSFGADYETLMNQSGQHFSKYRVGCVKLFEAVRGLCAFNENPASQKQFLIAQNLMVIIIMTSETIRFENLSEFLYEDFGQTRLLHVGIYALFRKWKKLSKLIHGERSAPLKIEGRGVVNSDEAKQLVAVALPKKARGGGEGGGNQRKRKARKVEAKG